MLTFVSIQTDRRKFKKGSRKDTGGRTGSIQTREQNQQQIIYYIYTKKPNREGK